MTVKEYLEQATRLDERILFEKQECQRLREMAQGLRSPGFGQRVDHSGSNEAPFVKELEKLAEEEKRREEDIKKMVALKIQINEVLRQVRNPGERTVLQMKYLHGKNWEEIAASLYSGRTTVRHWGMQGIRKITLPSDAISLDDRDQARAGGDKQDKMQNAS